MTKTETLYDRDETKLIERIVALRKSNPELKLVDGIKRPYDPGYDEDVFSAEVQIS